MVRYAIGLLVLWTFIFKSSATVSDWNNPSSSQYHIQTDEGNERYFRYQTISGQYRKEKRLEDGTVIGTYAWIDDNGYLRQRDYIADNAGYRILKTKNVYVGRETPIAQAIKSAKKVPPSAGTLVKTNKIRPQIVTPVTPPTPIVDVSPNSIPSSTPQPYEYQVPSSTPLPPYEYSIPSSTPAPFSPPTTALPIQSTTSLPSNLYLPAGTVALERARPSTGAPPYNQWYYSSDPQYDHPRKPPVSFHNGPTYPIDNRGQSYTGNNLGNGYDPQYDLYDGVSVTNDGFRYYIPRAYHEEQNLGAEKKSGSFGYIDPFGIRRVVYYNAGPGTGFQHRKNNRYVGFDATPYDPRPY